MSLRSPIVFQTTEYTENFKFECTVSPETDYAYKCDRDKTMVYTSPDQGFATALDKGGYVFNFEIDTLKTPDLDMTLTEVLSMPWNSERAVAQVSIE